jgi:hypothetical protein
MWISFSTVTTPLYVITSSDPAKLIGQVVPTVAAANGPQLVGPMPPQELWLSAVGAPSSVYYTIWVNQLAGDPPVFPF